MEEFTECSEERFHEMMGVVPPILGRNGFLVGEPTNHRTCKVTGYVKPTYTGFINLNGKFYESKHPMTYMEFKKFDRKTLK